MSFPINYIYTIQAKSDIRTCPELEPEFADSLFTDPSVYRNAEWLSNRVISDAEHELSIKLIFLAEMRSEFGQHFFGGNAPLTVEFFDRWWTLTKTDEPTDVSDIVKAVDAQDFEMICRSFSDPLVSILKDFR